MPRQEQKPVEDFVDQPDGSGVMELASFIMAEPSSAVADDRMRRERDRRRTGWP
jgi:hypothetical protein